MYCRSYLGEQLDRTFEFKLELNVHVGGTKSLCSPSLAIDRRKLRGLSFADSQVKHWY